MRGGACLASSTRGGTLPERCIEQVIGQLVTDEEFREAFLDDPRRILGNLLEHGMRLTHGEIAALIATDPSFWTHVADQIDARLQKASLKG